MSCAPFMDGLQTRGNVTLATPTIASRVTSAASCSSVIVPVPLDARAEPDNAVPRCCPRRALRHLRAAACRTRADAARVDHRARPIGRGLVPDRRQAEHRPRITRAQRAHDQVVDLGPVLHHQRVLTLPVRVAQLGDRGWRVLQQAFLVGGIHPGARHHACAVARAYLVFHRVDECVERGWIDQAFFHEERLERLDSQREVRRDDLMLASGSWPPP